MGAFGKRLTACVLSAALLLACLGPAADGAPAAEEELRAVWVASVYNLDYPTRPTTDPGALKKEADAILRGCADMGMNAVILQVRPSCDALYPSLYFPWSRYLTGLQGAAPLDGFDPLAYWVERAHALGLELHAWLNPFRVTKGGLEEFETLSAASPAVLHPDWVVEHEGDYYLDPGLPEVRELVILGAEELVRNYDLDGVHLDDYFYPGVDFDDAGTYARYGRSFADVGDWRRDNVNLLVRDLGERLHAIAPDLSYGISPAGVWANRSSLPQGSDTNGYETYFSAYADSRLWVKEGWVDYICPQLYWHIGYGPADYKTLANWWSQVVRGTGVRLYIGMADYLSSDRPDSVWYGTRALEEQLDLNDTLPEISGEAHFRYQLMASKPPVKALYERRYAGGPAPALPAPEGRPRLGGSGAYIQGSGGRFRPEAPLSRGEAVALLARLTVDEAGEPLFRENQTYPISFPDVPRDQWYAPYVGFAAWRGLASGYVDGTFRPEAPVSRAELVKLLSAYFELPGAGGAAFQDVPPRHWAAGAVAYAADQGWVSGYPDGAFRPEQSVSRAEAVKIINRALGRHPAGEGEDSPFSDVTPGYWAFGDILAAARGNAD